MTHKDTILVTGASGFIGGWIVETLHLRGSTHVRAGIRSWKSAARLGRFPIDIVLCDVMDMEQITQAMEGVAYIIHCAYGSSEVTVQGTENMLKAAQRSEVKRFVHLSTTEVYGNVVGEIDEAYPFQDSGNLYADSKIKAEKICWEYCNRGVPVTVIRPPIVYGPFGRTWTIELASKIQSGNWGAFRAHGDGICNLIYVADLVSGILLALDQQNAVGEAFNLSGPEAITWNQYFQRFNSAMGLPPLGRKNSHQTKLRVFLMEPIRRVAKFGLNHFESPVRKLSQRCRFVKMVLRTTEKSIRTTPRLADLSLYKREALYITSKAQKLLGYEPRYRVDAGLKLTTRWLDQVGLVDRST